MGDPKYDRWQLYQVLMPSRCIIYILVLGTGHDTCSSLLRSHYCDVILIRSKIPVHKYAM